MRTCNSLYIVLLQQNGLYTSTLVKILLQLKNNSEFEAKHIWAGIDRIYRPYDELGQNVDVGYEMRLSLGIVK